MNTVERCPFTSSLRNEDHAIMNVISNPSGNENAMLPEGANIFSRKVARSGHISFEGHPYFISKALAGRYIRLVVLADRLIVDASIPLHKEYSLV
jgi:hypothetical protein